MRAWARASAGPSTSNLGHGFDVLGIALKSRVVARDLVTVTPAARWTVTVSGPEADGVPADPETNVAARAARVLVRRPLALHLWKGVPPGRGLGSSGASAAAGARAAAALLGDRVPMADIVAAAAEGERVGSGAAHADNVAPQLLGGLVCIPDGPRGGLYRFALPRHVVFAVGIPEVRLTTRRARSVVPAAWSRAAHVRETGRAVATALLLVAGDVARVGEVIRDSLVENARAGLIRGYAKVVRAAERAGAPAVTISGSGSCMIAIVDRRRTDPAKVAAAMARGFIAAGVPARPAVCTVADGATARSG